MAAGARAREMVTLLGVGLTTMQHWRRQLARGGDGVNLKEGQPSPCGSPPQRRRMPTDLPHLQRAQIHGPAARPDCDGVGGSGPQYQFIEQLRRGAPCPRAGASARTEKVTTEATTSTDAPYIRP